jgi:transcriptional regulator with XRE-family HTH domain
MKTIYKPKYEEIVAKLKKAREEAGLRQDDVALPLKKYQSYLSKIENGDRRIDIVELIELAQMYGKDLSYFVGNIPIRKVTAPKTSKKPVKAAKKPAAKKSGRRR